MDQDKQIAALNEVLAQQAQSMRWISDAVHDTRSRLEERIGSTMYELTGIDKEFKRITEAIHLPAGQNDAIYLGGDRVIILGMFHHVPCGIGYVVEESNTQPGWWIVDVVGYGKRAYERQYLRKWEEKATR
jgi:hypothetical protein